MRTYQTQCPCRTCEGSGCGAFHDQCELYQEFRQQVELERKREHEEKSKNSIFSGFSY